MRYTYYLLPVTLGVALFLAYHNWHTVVYHYNSIFNEHIYSYTPPKYFHTRRNQGKQLEVQHLSNVTPASSANSKGIGKWFEISNDISNNSYKFNNSIGKIDNSIKVESNFVESHQSKYNSKDSRININISRKKMKYPILENISKHSVSHVSGNKRKESYATKQSPQNRIQNNDKESKIHSLKKGNIKNRIQTKHKESKKYNLKRGKSKNRIQNNDKESKKYSLERGNNQNRTQDNQKENKKYSLKKGNNKSKQQNINGIQDNKMLLVPNTFHFIWLYAPVKTNFTFLHITSVLSVFYRHQPDVVYFWCDIIPQGKWWNKLQDIVANNSYNFRVRNIAAPAQISGENIQYPEHKSDFVRLKILYKYGGIYIDNDVLVLKPLYPLMKYQNTLGRENKAKVTNGVILSVPKSVIIKMWIERYEKSYLASCFTCESVKMANILSYRYPYLVNIEPSLIKPVRKDASQLFETGTYVNWTGIYTTNIWQRFFPRLDEIYTPETIKSLNTVAAQAYRLIWYNRTDILKME